MRHVACTHAHIESAASRQFGRNLARFGVAGPAYEIVNEGTELPGGDRLMRVRVVETGEEVDYRFTDILSDPLER
jgi:Family of unknown function (DUF5397)